LRRWLLVQISGQNLFYTRLALSVFIGVHLWLKIVLPLIILQKSQDVFWG